MTFTHMVNKKPLLGALILSLALAACGDNAEGEGEATESELGDIDVLEGSVSDDMITLDRFGENPLARQTNAENTTGADDAASENNNSQDSDSSGDEEAETQDNADDTDSAE